MFGFGIDFLASFLFGLAALLLVPLLAFLLAEFFLGFFDFFCLTIFSIRLPLMSTLLLLTSVLFFNILLLCFGFYQLWMGFFS